MKQEWKAIADKYTDEELIILAIQSIVKSRDEGYFKRIGSGKMLQGDFNQFVAQALAERLQKANEELKPLIPKEDEQERIWDEFINKLEHGWDEDIWSLAFERRTEMMKEYTITRKP